MPLPLYAHPTLTVLIDDSACFLESLAFQLDPRLNSVCFHDAATALSWLRLNSPRQGVRAQVNFNAPILQHDHCNVSVDIEQIYRISEQRRRFATPAVLVLDYAMPQMNGLEFCAAIRDLPCKKILFTGTADEKIAVSAFNQGLIDRYIRKSDANALDQLECDIIALQRAFFSAQSDHLRELLLMHNYEFLGDPAIATLVGQLVRQHGFVEHYLFASPTGILLIDQYGRASLLVVETAQGMRAQFEVARDNDAPASLQQALEKCSVLTFFGDDGGDGMYTSAYARHWHRYSQAPQLCHGRETYYWALFDLPPAYLHAPLLSHAQFLREQSDHQAA